MICDALSLRSSRGLSVRKKRPVLAVCALPVAAGLRAEALDVRIACRMNVAELVHQAHHFVGRRLLRRLGETLNNAGILDREKSLRDLDRHDHRQRHGGEEHAERDRLVAQDDVERAPVERQHGVEAALDDPIDAAVRFGFALHEARAHHRRQRQRHNGRYRDRRRDR